MCSLPPSLRPSVRPRIRQSSGAHAAGRSLFRARRRRLRALLGRRIKAKHRLASAGIDRSSTCLLEEERGGGATGAVRAHRRMRSPLGSPADRSARASGPVPRARRRRLAASALGPRGSDGHDARRCAAPNCFAARRARPRPKAGTARPQTGRPTGRPAVRLDRPPPTRIVSDLPPSVAHASSFLVFGPHASEGLRASSAPVVSTDCRPAALVRRLGHGDPGRPKWSVLAPVPLFEAAGGRIVPVARPRHERGSASVARRHTRPRRPNVHRSSALTVTRSVLTWLRCSRPVAGEHERGAAAPRRSPPVRATRSPSVGDARSFERRRFAGGPSVAADRWHECADRPFEPR